MGLSAFCGPFPLYSLGTHCFWICDVRGHIPTCILQYLFMDLSINLSLSLNYLEVNLSGNVVQGMKLLGVCISESYAELLFLSTK